jgi:hypothetical protein
MNTIITKHEYVLELLNDLANRQPEQRVELIICSSRGNFFEQVQVEVENYQDGQNEDGNEIEDESDSTSEQSFHPLLSRTLHIIGGSHRVNLTFCPSIPTLRGYLASLPSPTSPHISPSPPTPPSSLFILNLLALHYNTTEFTLQGLSLTLSSAISSATRTKSSLHLIECKDVRDPGNPHRGSALWKAEVRMLSAAVKIGEAGQGWGRRTLSVESIAGRWFEFEGRGREDEMLV